MSVLTVSAQQSKQVQLTASEKFKGFTKSGLMRIIRPVFTHEGSTLAADSADFNQGANTFDAYGHVVITQPGGTTVYSDVLNYNGNSRLALLTGNVRLVDKDAVLTTNYLTYNMATRIGTYTGGGQIVNGPNVLNSKNGYYFASTRDAYFRYDVVVNTPDAVIKTDTLKYNTGTRVSYFYGPTNIKSKTNKSNLYTENGSYNTVTDQAWFGKKNLYTEESKTLRGDSLYYDGPAGFGKAINNITFVDTEQKITLKGNQGIYRRADESALVTRNAYVVLQTEPDSGKVDSIWMAADTLLTKLIYLRDLPPVKKEELKSDKEVDADSLSANSKATEVESVTIVGAGVPTTVTASDSTRADTLAAPKPEVRKSPKKKKGFLGLFSRKNTGRKAAVPDSTSTETGSGPQLKPETNVALKDSLSSDSLAKEKGKQLKVPLDTTKTRIVLAYRKMKIFKADLQAKADSAFYSYADSTIRCYYSPMMWTQGSQLSADTVYLQLKNKKLDNMLLQHDGFVVSTERDSTKFNQVKGKTLTGLFRDNQLQQMFVDGNAESIYYTMDDSLYSGLNRSVSSRMKLIFKDNKLQKVTLVRKPEGTYYPIENVDKDIEILEGFIWKPNERPKSKEEIIPSLQKKKPAARKPPAKKPAATRKK